MTKALLSVLLFVTFLATAQAGVLSGTVRDDNGAPMPFANVFIQGTTIGTTANENGNYHLELAPGNYLVVYDYISYRKKVEHITIGDGPMTFDETLETEDIKLQAAVVKASEDPAYEIMRHAIATREKHYDQVQNYNCQTYVKELQRIITAPKKVLGITVNFNGSLDSNNSGIIYLSESVSELTYRKPEDIKEVMVSSKVSGESQSFSWNRAAEFIRFDFYKNQFAIETISDQHFISPLASNAMGYYKFRLEGSYLEDNKVIYKIEVKPKAGSGPAFKGYVYIIDNDWSLRSVDLMLTKKDALISYVDTLRFNYNYTRLNDSLSVLLSQRFDFNFNINLLGIKAAGYVVAVYRDYKVNMLLPKNTFTDEILKISLTSNTRTKDYWDSIRPVPLTEAEMNDYPRKDTLEKKRQSKTFLDSLDREANKPTAFSMLFGYHYYNSYRKLHFRIFQPLQMVEYNTVEGWNLRLDASVAKEFRHRKELYINPRFRYGFSNGHVNGTLLVNYIYNQPMRAGFNVEGGKYVYQFNNGNPISDIMNTFTTLFLDKNYMKVYEDRFVRLNHYIEPVNGFSVSAGINVSRRYHLVNTSFEKAIKWKGEVFTSNDSSGTTLLSFTNTSGTEPVKLFDATIFDILLRYQPGQKYISRPDMKIEMEPKWPSFTLSYYKAIPGIVGSAGNYDYVSLNINQTFSLGNFGNSRYSITGGTFPNTKYMGFMDYHHFDGNFTPFGLHYFTGFQLLQYYAASTNKSFVEAHYEHHLNGLFLSRIPKLNKLKWQLIVGGHYLYTPDFKSYGELVIGIENILQIARVDFVNGFSSRTPYSWGFRAGINFNDL